MTSKTNKDTKIKTPKSHSQDSIPSFIRKTYDILEESRFPDVIDWNTEGTALVIKKPTEFCQKVLPAYFKHNNLTSFVRQLNMYNFHKRRTQTLDHIYYHELFQQGKKHLLKEIRRKTHEITEKAQKSPESPESTQQEQDFSTLSCENQFLKKLYNDAMTKISALEAQVNEMTAKNQSLLSQFNQKSQSKPVFEKQPELTHEQLPMTLGRFSIPPLKITVQCQSSSQQESMPIVKNASINSFLNFGEEATDSTATEISQSSPMVQQATDSDKCFDMPEGGQALMLPPISLVPQVNQAPKQRNDLFISKGEMSVGQLFEAFSSEGLKLEEDSLLGKRFFEQSGSISFAEPAMKRVNDLSIFNKKMLSNSAEEREMFRMMLRRESSINDGMIETDLDLIDFNNPFSVWTKST